MESLFSVFERLITNYSIDKSSSSNISGHSIEFYVKNLNKLLLDVFSSKGREVNDKTDFIIHVIHNGEDKTLKSFMSTEGGKKAIRLLKAKIREKHSKHYDSILKKIEDRIDQRNDMIIVRKILKKVKNHPEIQKEFLAIKKSVPNLKTMGITEAKEILFDKIIRRMKDEPQFSELFKKAKETSMKYFVDKKIKLLIMFLFGLKNESRVDVTYSADFDKIISSDLSEKKTIDKMIERIVKIESEDEKNLFTQASHLLERISRDEISEKLKKLGPIGRSIKK